MCLECNEAADAILSVEDKIAATWQILMLAAGISDILNASVRIKKLIFEIPLHTFDMLTLNTILKELKNVPVDRLEDLYSIIHSLKVDTKKTDIKRKKILSFAGSFDDMSKKDYYDFTNETKEIRKNLFDRDINL